MNRHLTSSDPVVRGESPAVPNPVSARGTNMDSRQRLTTSMGGAVPVAQHTPDQQWFRDNASGRWQADYDTGTHAPTNSMTLGPDGTLDVVRLDADGKAHIDLGGRGGTDVAAGRP